MEAIKQIALRKLLARAKANLRVGLEQTKHLEEMLNVACAPNEAEPPAMVALSLARQADEIVRTSLYSAMHALREFREEANRQMREHQK